MSLYDFTRKSVVGAAYRVASSFTIDALYLTAIGAASYYLSGERDVTESITKSASDFVSNLDPAKLARITAAVVLINFGDYKYKITDKLDGNAKRLEERVKNLFTKN